MQLPEKFLNSIELEAFLAQPSEALVDFIRQLKGDIMILGHVVTLVAGENNIQLQVGQGGTSSFSLQCGNVNTGTVIEANTISISNLTFTAV